MEIKLVTTESEKKELDLLFWEILWKPLGLPDNIQKSFSLDGEKTEIAALSGSKIVGGLAAYRLSPSEVELRHIAVKPESQGKSAGSRLVKELIKFFSERNCEIIRTVSRNTSVDFFTKLGFVTTDENFPDHPAFKKHGISFKVMEFRFGKKNGKS